MIGKSNSAAAPAECPAMHILLGNRAACHLHTKVCLLDVFVVSPHCTDLNQRLKDFVKALHDAKRSVTAEVEPAEHAHSAPPHNTSSSMKCC